jgi:hypothetical protein
MQAARPSEKNAHTHTHDAREARFNGVLLALSLLSTSLFDSQRTSRFTGRKFVAGERVLPFGFGFCFGFWLGCLGFTLDADRATVAKRRDRFGTRLREPEPNGETATEKLGL